MYSLVLVAWTIVTSDCAWNVHVLWEQLNKITLCNILPLPLIRLPRFQLSGFGVRICNSNVNIVQLFGDNYKRAARDKAAIPLALVIHAPIRSQAKGKAIWITLPYFCTSWETTFRTASRDLTFQFFVPVFWPAALTVVSPHLRGSTVVITSAKIQPY